MPDPAVSLLSPDYLRSLGADAQRAMLAAAQSEKLKRGLGHTALLALGAGSAARGLNGLYNVVRRNTQTPSRKTGPRMLPIPVVTDEPAKTASLGGLIRDFATGQLAETAGGMPIYRPLQLLTGAGALAAGWKATDALLDQRRRRDMAAELADAREDYEKALQKQGSAEASDLGRDLDALFERCGKLAEQLPEKSAGLTDIAKNLASRVGLPTAGIALGLSSLGAENAGQTTGAMLAVPTGLALAAGVYGHGYTRSRQREELLRKAQQRRRSRQLAAGQVYAYPTNADGSEYSE